MTVPYQEFPSDLRRLTPRTTALSGDPGSSIEGINTHDLPDGAICFAQDEGEDYRFRREATTAAVGSSIIQPTAGPGRWFIIHGSSCIVQSGSDETPLVAETGMAFDIADVGPFLYPRVNGVVDNPLRVPLPAFVPGNIVEGEVTFSFEFGDNDAAAEFRGCEVNVKFVIERTVGVFELISGTSAAVSMDNAWQAAGGIDGPKAELSASVRAVVPTVPSGTVTVYALVETVTKGGTFTSGDQSLGQLSGNTTICLRATEYDVGCVSQVAAHTFSVIVPVPPPFTPPP